MTLIFTKLLLLLTPFPTFTATAPSLAQNLQHPIGPSWFKHGQPNLRPEVPKIRNATLSDVPSIAKTFEDAFRPYPEWHYIYQFANQYPHYHQYCSREVVREIMERTTKDVNGVIKVITVPDEDDDSDGDDQREKVVSFAFWQFIDETTTTDPQMDVSTSDQQIDAPSNHLWFNFASSPLNRHKNTDPDPDPDADKERPPFNCSLHLDLNTTRLASILTQESAAITQYLSPAYPTRLYLALLATHPDHDGHGYAAAQVKLGLDWAMQRGLPVTLLATPAGYPVYKGAGFESVKNVTIGFLDGLGEEWEEVMVWEGGGQDRSSC